MKRYLSLLFLAAYVTAVVLCHLFGGALRDLASPQAVCVKPEYVLHENRIYISCASELLHAGEGGQYFIDTVIPTERYPEDAYEVCRLAVTPVFLNDEAVLVDARVIAPEMRLIVSADRPVADGDRITIAEE